MPAGEMPRFLKTLYGRNDERLIERLQRLLAEHRLSSHAWIVARKVA